MVAFWELQRRQFVCFFFAHPKKKKPWPAADEVPFPPPFVPPRVGPVPVMPGLLMDHAANSFVFDAVGFEVAWASPLVVLWVQTWSCPRGWRRPTGRCLGRVQVALRPPAPRLPGPLCPARLTTWALASHVILIGTVSVSVTGIGTGTGTGVGVTVVAMAGGMAGEVATEAATGLGVGHGLAAPAGWSGPASPGSQISILVPLEVLP